MFLQVLDTRWREHLDNMDYLRDGIGLRGLAQKNPLNEYRAEGYEMFHELQAAVKSRGGLAAAAHRGRGRHRSIRRRSARSTGRLQRRAARRRRPRLGQRCRGGLHGRVGRREQLDRRSRRCVPTADRRTSPSAGAAAPTALQEARVEAGLDEGEVPVVQQRRVEKPVGRNEPCPCGSGKKYKNCHGR